MKTKNRKGVPKVGSGSLQSSTRRRARDAFVILQNLSGAFGRSILLVILFGAALAGCAELELRTYPGDAVDPSKEVVIEAVYEHRSEAGRIYIAKLDDVRIDEYPGGPRGTIGAHRVYTLAGKHRVSIVLSGYTGQANLWLVAEPGETYLVKLYYGVQHKRVWIENKRTGKLTGGVVGSDDEPFPDKGKGPEEAGTRRPVTPPSDNNRI